MSRSGPASLDILLFDFSGHPFQAELSRELAARGHRVVHGSCAAYVSGKGDLAESTSGVSYCTIGRTTRIRKGAFFRRFFQEVRLGLELLGLVRSAHPDVVLVSTTPVPMAFLLAAFLWVRRTPWVLWHQDIQGIAVEDYAASHMPRYFQALARVYSRAERWSARRATEVIVIAESFLSVHQRWGTAGKVTVIPNWAPLHEIQPMARDNPWARAHDLVGERTLLYSGTLGLKHRPELLPQLARAIERAGMPVRLVVVNEGPAAQIVQEESSRLGVSLTLLPFQPYDRLADLLSAGDILVVLLEATASSFSVPSKSLSYLSAGRPVIGFMPAENEAARLIVRAGGLVVPPTEESLAVAAEWFVSAVSENGTYEELCHRSRALAETEFNIEAATDRFETLLKAAMAHSS